MTDTAFPDALAFTLKEEGGYVDNPHDHGGATNHGITQASYDEWRDAAGLSRCDVREIEPAEVQSLYGMMYWLPAHCEAMSVPLAVSHFDWCVNHGVRGALETLQRALKVTVDGDFGPHTLAALQAQDQGDLWREYNGLRRGWYRAQVAAHPDQAVFLKGWLGRVDRLDNYIEGLK